MLTIEIRDNKRNLYHIYKTDSIKDIEKYIDRLDGQRYDELMIRSDCILNIGGGKNNKYIIMFSIPEKDGLYHPARKIKSKKLVELRVGGLNAIVDEKFVLTNSDVKKIVKYFIKKNTRHNGIDWEKF